MFLGYTLKYQVLDVSYYYVEWLTFLFPPTVVRNRSYVHWLACVRRNISNTRRKQYDDRFAMLALPLSWKVGLCSNLRIMLGGGDLAEAFEAI